MGSIRAVGRLYPTPSDEAAELWREFARAHGVSYTSVIDALAVELQRLMTLKQLPPFWRRIISEAQARDAESRSREPID